ncbi:pyruvate dehydrogenase (acetyl-transferring) E1 component subunit alpha, partial [Streptosporangium sandarakinum]
MRRGADAERPPELVQLLTPEGERVEHPDYDIDLTPEEVRGL